MDTTNVSTTTTQIKKAETGAKQPKQSPRKKGKGKFQQRKSTMTTIISKPDFSKITVQHEPQQLSAVLEEFREEPQPQQQPAEESPIVREPKLKEPEDDSDDSTSESDDQESDPHTESDHVIVDEFETIPTWTDAFYRLGYTLAKNVSRAILRPAITYNSFFNLRRQIDLDDYLDTITREYDAKIEMCKPTKRSVVMYKERHMHGTIHACIPKVLRSRTQLTYNGLRSVHLFEDITPQLTAKHPELAKWMTCEETPIPMIIDDDVSSQMKITKLLSQPPSKEVFLQRLDQATNAVTLTNKQKKVFNSSMEQLASNPLNETSTVTGLNLLAAQKRIGNVSGFLRNH